MGEGVKRLLTQQEVELSIFATRKIMDLRLEEHPEFMAEYMKAFNLREEMEKTINLLENLQYWIQMGGAK